MEDEKLIEGYKAELKKWLNDKRYEHSLSVMNTAVELAKIHNIDIKKAQIAGLLHDIAKQLSLNEMQSLAEKYGLKVDEEVYLRGELLHAPLGAKIAEDRLNIDDKSVLAAISNHTSGDVGMDELSLLIFVSDIAEALRKPFEGLDNIRKLAKISLKDAAIEAIKCTKKYVEKLNLSYYNKTDLVLNDLIKRREKHE